MMRTYRISILGLAMIGLSWFVPYAQSLDTLFLPDIDTIPYSKWVKSHSPDATLATLIPEDYTLVINEFMASNGTVVSDQAGEFDDWIEIYNFGDQPVDLNGIYVTDDISNPVKWRFNSGSGPLYLSPGEFYIFWADGQPYQGPNHLSFKLSAEGEEIAIFTPDEQVLIDSVSFPQQFYDVSLGREPDGGVNWNYFLIPTPGSENSTGGLLDVLTHPQFSHSGGFYSNPITLSITSFAQGSQTRYTVDGTAPTESAPLFTELNIERTTTFRARSFRSGYMPSRIITHTFIYDPSESLDVISLVTDSFSLWGSNGILTNKNEGIEKQVSVEYLKKNGDPGFAVNAGVKIHAPDSKPQQSLRLSVRRMYGDERINYKIFPDKPVTSFKRLVLRNAGNDGSQLITQRTHFRDPIMHIISSETGSEITTSAYKPVHVYLNGNYWGIYNLRERIDRFYIESYFGTQDIDLLERSFGYHMNENAIEGDWNHFEAMKNFANTADLSIASNYSYIKTQMDVHNFSEYWIYVVYYGNFDWLSNNMKFWRARTASGRWQWIHWDLDHGLGLPYYNYSNPNWNTLAWSTSEDAGRPWEGYNTILIRNLLENETFKNDFINRFADLLNTAFVPDNLIPIVDSLEQMLDDDMPKQIARWGSTMGNWEIGIEGLRYYLNNRPGYVWEHIREKFDLDQPNQLEIRVIPEGAGKIEVNFVTVKQFPWNGKYFEEIPITLKAIPNFGYEFSGWNGINGASPEMNVNLEENQVLTAYFSVSHEVKDLIINEINYNAAQSLETGDWIEIYNPNQWEVSLNGYSLKDGDEDHQYIINDNYTIAPYGYFVFAQDTILMKAFFPGLMTLTGNFDFGFNSNGESVRLYNESGLLIDSVRYSNVPPWPPAADGSGATLELIEHNPENEDPWNWQASFITGGTPGLVNSNPGSSISNPGESVTDLTVYPNPGSGRYYLVFNNPRNGAYQIKILNLVGETVNGIKRQKFNKSEPVVIDLTNQPEGIYFIQVFSNGKMETLKVIKTD